MGRDSGQVRVLWSFLVANRGLSLTVCHASAPEPGVSSQSPKPSQALIHLLDVPVSLPNQGGSTMFQRKNLESEELDFTPDFTISGSDV